MRGISVRVLVSVMAAMGLSGCSDFLPGAQPPSNLVPLPFEEVLKTSTLATGVRTKRVTIVRDDEQWAEIWSLIHERVEPGSRPPLPAVDFEQERLLLVSAGVKQQVGYEIEVRYAKIDPGPRHTFRVHETWPPCNAEAREVTPLQVIRFRGSDDTDLGALFFFSEERRNCP